MVSKRRSRPLQLLNDNQEVLLSTKALSDFAVIPAEKQEGNKGSQKVGSMLMQLLLKQMK
jgi:hypothetical protein